jgi:hypothetical protein
LSCSTNVYGDSFTHIPQINAGTLGHGYFFVADFTLTLRLVDQSRPAGISVTFFADNAALLPCVKSSGDVISLHNVVV